MSDLTVQHIHQLQSMLKECRVVYGLYIRCDGETELQSVWESKEAADRMRDAHNNMRGNGAFYYGKASVSPLHIRTQAMADLMLGPAKGAAA